MEVSPAADEVAEALTAVKSEDGFTAIEAIKILGLAKCKEAGPALITSVVSNK